MRYVEEMDLDKVELIAEAHSSKGDIRKLRHNLRFVRDLGVYEELLGPTIREPEPIPSPEKMSREDFERMVKCENIEVMEDDASILRWCKAFTVLQTKQVDAGVIQERRPIK